MANARTNARGATTTLAAYFEQFDKLKVTSDVSADNLNVEVIVVSSTATSHGARVYVDYKYKFVDVQFVNRYTLEPNGRRQHVKSTVELEQLLRKHKVLVNAKIISFEAASDDQLLTLAKGEGFDDMNNAAGRAYWHGADDGTLTFVHRGTLIKAFRGMGYQSVDVTDPNWIMLATTQVSKPGEVIVTEAEWLNGMRKPRQRRFV